MFGWCMGLCFQSFIKSILQKKQPGDFIDIWHDRLIEFWFHLKDLFTIKDWNEQLCLHFGGMQKWFETFMSGKFKWSKKIRRG